ncbi:MAG: hypothetical protein ILP11_04315 [Alphaproteobacteria bacterium]|nr:hypothetical protein [Alphaproteobacteria bacterium]
MILTLIFALFVTTCVYYYMPAQWLHNLTFWQQVAFVALIVGLCFLLPRLLMYSVRLFLSLIVMALVYTAYLYFTNPNFANGIQAWLEK